MRVAFLFLTVISLFAPESFSPVPFAVAGELADYTGQGEARIVENEPASGSTVSREIVFEAPVWQDAAWTHRLRVVTPPTGGDSGTVLLLVGSKPEEPAIMEELAATSGVIVASLGDIPNQPLFDGLKEDALVSYTLKRYLETKDPSWPLLFPMVRSVRLAMNVLEETLALEPGRKRFIVSGASKRGWTTWLTGAVEPRVLAIAPRVFDMLNMPAQARGYRDAFGGPSFKVASYTEKGFFDRIDAPEMAPLLEWLDPYRYRESLTMPKLVLLGSNDPYWTVDAAARYWNDLPEPKLLHESPNTGHGLPRESWIALARWTKRIASGSVPRSPEWNVEKGRISVTGLESCLNATMWTAYSETKDFRNAAWTSYPLQCSGTVVHARLIPPREGYRASFIAFEERDGLRGSTRAFVFP